jgi:molybdopterin-guanine dinucleotide biosynthesis protein A
LKRSAIILAGGTSKRFGKDKAWVNLLGKPMILHVYDHLAGKVDEVIIVVRPETQLDQYKRLVKDVSIVVDEGDRGGPLIGAIAGLKSAEGDYSLLIGCDTPLLSGKVVSLLFERVEGYEAVIPRWPNGYTEPLQAVYRTKEAYASGLKAVENHSYRMLDMLTGLKRIPYLPTLEISKLDPYLDTFFNVNTQSDLLEAEEILKLRYNNNSKSCV